MSGDRKYQADLDRSIELLQKSVSALHGKPVTVALHRDGQMARLTFDGFEVTTWNVATTAVWNALLDIRNAINTLRTLKEQQ